VGTSRSRMIQRMFDELQRAVEREEFERAAELRDEIKKLEDDPGIEQPAEKEKHK
jgi:protein-arginine kinase activator protein McsA